MYNKRKDIITTSVTNLDLHDISRAARTFNVDGFFVVHPSASQQELIQKIVGFWQEGYGGEYNPDRKEAFSIFKTVADLEEAIKLIREKTGQEVLTVATDAGNYPNSVTYQDLKEIIFNEEKVFLVLFGTGFGMKSELVENCDYILQPIIGGGDYNHLSVRSAVSIIVDRLLGEFWYNQ
jgi:hypothetical protein